MIVYEAVNNINGKKYVGQTILSLSKRRSIHKSKAINGSKLLFHKALREHGFNSFRWRVLCECNSKLELSEKEEVFIKIFDTMEPNGYNMYKGYNGVTETAREKIRQKKLGVPRTEITKQRISNSLIGTVSWNKGRSTPNDVRRKISFSRSGVTAKEKHHMWGKHHSKETREKIGKSHFGLYDGNKNPNAKRYLIIEPNGEERIIDCLKTYCVKNKLCYTTMIGYVIKKGKSHKGYKCQRIGGKVPSKSQTL